MNRMSNEQVRKKPESSPEVSASIGPGKGSSRRKERRSVGWPVQVMVAAFASLLVGCTHQVDLIPAPGADVIAASEDHSVARVEGVELKTSTDAWSGAPELEYAATPVHVSIENNSGRALKLRYSDFALLDPSGERYAALAPFAVEGTVEQPVLVDGYAVVERPGISYSGFYVAPYYAPAYPTLHAYRGPFFFDPYYNSYYHRAWVQRDMPTERMLNRALPEGVVEDGGYVKGFLYFEHVDADEPRVWLRAQLVDAETGEHFAMISIPFLVEVEL